MSELLVVKKDGRREEFSRDKLLRGLRKACEKRPLAAGTVEAVVDAIDSALRQRGAPEVPSQEIGELVMDHLRDLDDIAYIRFASVYREFADIEDVRQELEALTTRGPAGVPAGDQPTLLPDDELKALTRGVRPFPVRRPGAPAGRRSGRRTQPEPRVVNGTPGPSGEGGV